MAKATDTPDAINDLDEFLDNVDENGRHLTQVSGIRWQAGRDGRNWVIFKFEVTDPDNPLEGEEYEKWVQDHSHLNTENYNELTGKEKSKVRADRKRLIDTLYALGFNEDDAKEIRKNPKSDKRNQVKGNAVRIEISVSESNGREFKNIVGIFPVKEDEGNPLNPPF